MDLLFMMDFIIPALIVIGIISLTVKLFSTPKEKRFDPDAWKKFGLALSVVLVFPFMVGYGFTTFIDKPAMDNSYSSIEPSIKRNYNQSTNSSIPSIQYFADRAHTKQVEEPEFRQLHAKYETARIKAYNDYDEADQKFHTYMFVTFVGFGVMAIIGGLVTAIPAASVGTLYGGILSMLFGFVSFWNYMNEAAIFVSLLLTFGTLIYIAYKKFGKPKSEA